MQCISVTRFTSGLGAKNAITLCALTVIQRKDSTAAGSQLQFLPQGDPWDWVPVTVTNDVIYEPNPEVFYVKLTGTTNARISNEHNQATCIIYDDDNPPQPPEFEDDDDVYEFTLGEGATRHVEVGRVTVADPDSQSVTFSITSGNDEGYFKIKPSGPDAPFVGVIEVAKNLPLDGVLSYQLTVEAADPQNNTDTATVNITLKPLVVITGDIHGVEATSDTIRLELIRYSHDISEAMQVRFRVTWDTASRQDFVEQEHPLVVANGNGCGEGEATIPAGEDRFSFGVLTPVADGVREGKEWFTVELLVDAAYNYTSVKGAQDLKLKKAGFAGKRQAEVIVVDAITLFGANNADGNKRDNNTTGVHFNDIAQGFVGDCYFMSAIAAIAQRHPDWLRNNVFTTNPDGTVSVEFFRNTGQPPTTVTVAMTLEYGWTQAELTDDTDDEGKYEVWPIIWEKAYRELVGWDKLDGGGRAAEVWNQIFGGGSVTESTENYTQGQLVDMLRDLLSGGYKVVLATVGKDKKTNWRLSNGQSLVGNHCYLLIGEKGNEFEVYDPWGSKREIPFDDLKSFIASIYMH